MVVWEESNLRCTGRCALGPDESVDKVLNNRGNGALKARQLVIDNLEFVGVIPFKSFVEI